MRDSFEHHVARHEAADPDLVVCCRDAHDISCHGGYGLYAIFLEKFQAPRDTPRSADSRSALMRRDFAASSPGVIASSLKRSLNGENPVARVGRVLIGP